MASIESISDNVYEAVSRSAREKEKSYDEAVKEFPEVFDELILDRKKEVFDFAVANMHMNAEPLKKSYDQDVEAYLKTREKYKTEPKKLLDWIATNARIYAEDKKNLELQRLKLMI